MLWLRLCFRPFITCFHEDADESVLNAGACSGAFFTDCDKIMYTYLGRCDVMCIGKTEYEDSYRNSLAPR